MRRTVLIGVFVLGFIFLLSLHAVAQNKVIVIPLLGDEQQIPAPVEKTGQTTSYIIGDDGNLEIGVAWPTPRFHDNNDGTITDKLTGLVWLKNANCFGTGSWIDALYFSNGLSGGSCGLSDGSQAGDWHLPNRKELLSIINLGTRIPAISNTAGTGKWSEGDPFTSVQSSYYWTSTYTAGDINYAWCVDLNDGNVSPIAKNTNWYVWPVREGNQ